MFVIRAINKYQMIFVFYYLAVVKIEPLFVVMGSGSSDKQFIFYPVFQSVCNLDIRGLNLILIYLLVINSQFKEFSMFKN